MQNLTLTMLKHSVTTPALKRHDFQEVRNDGKDNVSLSSSSSSDSSLLAPDPGFDHEHVARHVWDRYTSASSLATGNRSLIGRETGNRSSARVEPGIRKATCLESSAKPRSVPTDTNLNMSTVTNIDPKDPPADVKLSQGDFIKAKKVEEISRAKEKDPKKRNKNLFGLTKAELKIVGLVSVLCLVLYIVLLILTVKVLTNQIT